MALSGTRSARTRTSGRCVRSSWTSMSTPATQRSSRRRKKPANNCCCSVRQPTCLCQWYYPAAAASTYIGASKITSNLKPGNKLRKASKPSARTTNSAPTQPVPVTLRVSCGLSEPITVRFPPHRDPLSLLPTLFLSLSRFSNDVSLMRSLLSESSLPKGRGKSKPGPKRSTKPSPSKTPSRRARVPR